MSLPPTGHHHLETSASAMQESSLDVVSINYSQGQGHQESLGVSNASLFQVGTHEQPVTISSPLEESAYESTEHGVLTRNGATINEAASAAEDGDDGVNVPHSDTSMPKSTRKRDAGKVSKEANEKQKKRRLLACDSCRRRKVKCDSVKPSCSGCRRHGLVCHYQTEIRKRGSRVNYVEQLERKVELMERILRSEHGVDWSSKLLPYLSLPDGAMKGSSTHDSSAAHLVAMNIGSRSTSIDGSEMSVLTQAPATLAGMATVPAMPPMQQHTQHHLVSAEMAAPTIFAAPKNVTTSNAMLTAPARDLTEVTPELRDHLLGLYFRYVAHHHFMFDQATFYVQLTQGRIPPALLYSMHAIAVRFTQLPNVASEERHMAGRGYALRAQMELNAQSTTTDLAFVQTLANLCIHELGCRGSSKIWEQLRDCIRAAMSLHLHLVDKEPDDYDEENDTKRDGGANQYHHSMPIHDGQVMTLPDATPMVHWLPSQLDSLRKTAAATASSAVQSEWANAEERRRTWWTCFMLDRLAIATHGHTTLINEQDCLTCLPRDTDHLGDLTAVTRGESGDFGCTPVQRLTYMIRLLNILGQIAQLVNRPRPRSMTASECLAFPLDQEARFEQLDQELQKWFAALPSWMRCVPEAPTATESTERSRQFAEASVRVALLSFYHTAVILLHRSRLGQSKQLPHYIVNSPAAQEALYRCRASVDALVALATHLTTEALPYQHPLLSYAFFTAGTLLIHDALVSDTNDPRLAKSATHKFDMLLCVMDYIGAYWESARHQRQLLIEMMDQGRRFMTDSAPTKQRPRLPLPTKTTVAHLLPGTFEPQSSNTSYSNPAPFLPAAEMGCPKINPSVPTETSTILPTINTTLGNKLDLFSSSTLTPGKTPPVLDNILPNTTMQQQPYAVDPLLGMPVNMFNPSMLDLELWKSVNLDNATSSPIDTATSNHSVEKQTKSMPELSPYSDAAMVSATDLTLLAGVPGFSFDADAVTLSNALSTFCNPQQTMPLTSSNKPQPMTNSSIAFNSLDETKLFPTRHDIGSASFL